VDKQKILKFFAEPLVLGIREAVEILLSPETGTAPGETPVTQERPGNRFSQAGLWPRWSVEQRVAVEQSAGQRRETG
jgi:hypothetical protein